MSISKFRKYLEQGKTMAELKLSSKYPDSLKRIIQSALSERLHGIEAGIKRTTD